MPFVTRRFGAGELIADKYLLLSLLGRGASGEVFRTRNVLAGKILALKLLIEETGRETDRVQRFFREARAINRIGHRNIVSVFDAGYADAVPYIAMEYLDGESLAHLLERKQSLPLPAAVAVMLEVLDALAAAHRAHIVHRDLKPANVFVQAVENGTPQIKLLDFGVAKIREDDETSIKTESGTILGTPDYLSPEQITADSEVDGRADLFAAGSLLFELLSGKRPFHGPSFVATTYRIVHEPAPPLLEAESPAAAALAPILERALSKNPEQRYATAQDFARDLEQLCPDPTVRREALVGLDVRPTPSADADEARPRSRSTRPPTLEPDEDPAAAPSPAPSPIPIPDEVPAGSALRRRLSRTWSDLPIVGKRKTGSVSAGNVRGTILLAIDRAIATRYGSDVREEILATVPRELREAMGAHAVRPDTWYGLAQVATYLEAANRVAVHDDRDRWQTMGYAGVETDLLTLLRNVRGQSETTGALRVGVSACSGLFDFGRWTIDEESDPLRILLAGFGHVPPSLIDWLAGVIEHAARAAGRPYRVTVARPAAGADPPTVIELVITLRG